VLRRDEHEGGHPDVARVRLLHELLFVQNYRFGIWLHTWSPAVEEHLHFLLPLPLLLLVSLSREVKDPFKAMPYLFVLLTLACLAARIIGTRAEGARVGPLSESPGSLRCWLYSCGTLPGRRPGRLTFPQRTKKTSIGRLGKPTHSRSHFARVPNPGGSSG